jgi:cytochrome c oxidase subunit 2
VSRRGPSLLKAYGQKVTLADGTEVLRDDNYIRESIEKPQARLVKGYEPVMPTFQGLLSETEMNALIAYIKSLK